MDMWNYNTRTQFRFTLLITILFFLLFESSCKKFIEVDAPITSVNTGNVYNENSNAIAVLTGLYAKMSDSRFSLNLSVYPDLSADNLSLYDQNTISKLFYQNALKSNSSIPFWGDLYSYVYITNAAIEGLTKSTSLSPIVKQRLLGESYFMRGFYYFYLLNLYGEVPLILSTDYLINSRLQKQQMNIIYEQIIDDLNRAKSLMDNNYVDGTVVKESIERVRPNGLAASALLSRVYLYMKKYSLAESEATKVINQSDLYSLVELNSVFLKHSREVIWSLQPVSSSIITNEGSFYIYSNAGPDGLSNTFLSDNFLQSFESGDERKINWIGEKAIGNKTYSYPFKYKIKSGDAAAATEYTVVLRLAEQYLIRAEARVEQNNFIDAKMDLNAIRRRAGLIETSASGLQELRAAISKERRSELFTEWGNRWFDLKRTGNIDAVMQSISLMKGGIWLPFKSLFPLPLYDIQRNPNLTQNSGYQ